MCVLKGLLTTQRIFRVYVAYDLLGNNLTI